MQQNMGTREWLLLVTLAAIWGGSYFFVDLALLQLPVLSIVTLRVAGAALCLLVVVYMSGRKMPSDWRSWQGMLCIGLLNNALPFCLIVWGQTAITGGLAAILIAMTPLFSIVLLRLFCGEAFIAYKVAGLLAGLAGVTVIIGPQVLTGLTDNIFAQSAVLLAALCYAGAGIYGWRLQRSGHSSLIIATGQVCTSTLLLLPLTLLIDKPWQLIMPGMQTWLAILSLAVVCTALAYLIYFRILSAAGPTNLLLVTFLAPVSAIALGSLLLDQQLASEHILGMLLVGSGLLIIDGRILNQILKLLRRTPVRAVQETER